MNDGQQKSTSQGGALMRGFAALRLPKIGWIVFTTLGLSVVGAVLLFYLLQWLLTGFDFFTWGWANWLLDTFTGMVLFFVLLLMFPALVMIVASMLLDYVVDAVEEAEYPGLPPKREVSFGYIALYILQFTAIIILVNLLVLPFYLLLPGLNFLISWTINGWLIGREYYDLVAMRRLTHRQMAALRGRHGGALFRNGFVSALLMTVPFLNLLMPVVAAAAFTHVFHALPWRAAAETPDKPAIADGRD